MQKRFPCKVYVSPGGGARERKKRRRGGGAGREREKASREGPVSRKVWRIRDCSVGYLLKSFVCFWFPSFAAARAFSSCGVGHHPPPWRAHSSLPWPLRPQSAGSRHVGSAVPAHGLRPHALRPPRGLWGLPGPGIEPVSPAPADGFLYTATRDVL